MSKAFQRKGVSSWLSKQVGNRGMEDFFRKKAIPEQKGPAIQGRSKLQKKTSANPKLVATANDLSTNFIHTGIPSVRESVWRKWEV